VFFGFLSGICAIYIDILLTGRRVGEILRMLAEKQAAFQDMVLYNMHKIFLSEGE